MANHSHFLWINEGCPRRQTQESKEQRAMMDLQAVVLSPIQELAMGYPAGFQNFCGLVTAVGPISPFLMEVPIVVIKVCLTIIC